MYQFRDTSIRKGREEVFLPTSAMNYDGIFLEDAIEGYQTLAIHGREMLSVNIETEDRDIGSIITKQTLPSRVIKVEYLLSNEDPEMILVNFRYLMEYLYRQNNVPIWFNDERDVIYYGRYSTSDEVPGNVYTFESSFQILCPDPRKFTKVFKSKDGYIGARLPYPVRPLRISVTLAKSGGLKITDGIKTISASRANFSAGDKVVCDFTGGKAKLLHNGINKAYFLDLTSDFENFYLFNGQRITCDNGTLEVEYQEVYH